MIRRKRTIDHLAFCSDDFGEKELKDEKQGKWMYFFNKRDYAILLCEKAVETGIVKRAILTIDSPGVACFYLNSDDIQGHKRVIQFFLEHELINKTDAGIYSNISFKLNSQSKRGEYGDNFKPTLTLRDFLDLRTGKFLEEEGEV